MADSYANLVERISQASKLGVGEIEGKIEVKRAKLSGLISKEGAAQIVAAELGVSFDNELMKINELVEGMKRARVVGKVTEVFPIRSFSKNGREGKVCNFFLGDEGSNFKVVLWDVNHIALFEKGEMGKDSVVEISNASVRNGELHLGAFSGIKLSGQKMDNVKSKREASKASLKDIKTGDYIRVRASVVQMFEPKYFDDKKQEGKKRALVNFVIDDGTESIRALMNDQKLGEFGLTNEEIFSPELFAVKKNDLLGEELFFIGAIRMNTYFNRPEFNVEKIERVDVNELLKELEA